MVDFISYAYFEVHIEKLLDKMDKAWLAIHKNKKIFVKLGIHERFNIPRLHSLIHYISAIRSHETLNGYKTKSPECLYIEFAKIPFRTGNKWDYTAQMATWMTCHDAIRQYKMFLQWAKVKGILENVSLEDGDGVKTGKKRKWWQEDAKLDDVEVSGSHGYRVVKKLGYGNLHIDDLINKLGREDFIWYLEKFLLANSLPIPLSLCDKSIPFGVFKCLTVSYTASNFAGD